MLPDRRAAAALLLLFSAASCAKPRPPTAAAPVPAATPAPQSTNMDGTYRGTSTRYQADLRSCPSPGLVTLRVLDGTFSYRWNRDESVLATVGPDGGVSGASGSITLTGRADGNRISGDASNGSCAYHFTTARLS
ncbi:MAG: hypothetical protein JOZ42_12510 [Acetobacteraceae bacterium]|nr:hypothetical protein [Acetobacteraceae bacterium]